MVKLQYPNNRRGRLKAQYRLRQAKRKGKRAMITGNQRSIYVVIW